MEELPAADVMNRQLERVHRKQVLEEDQKAIELLQEAFMGGEEIAPRERKFRWKNIGENGCFSVSFIRRAWIRTLQIRDSLNRSAAWGVFIL